jgi:hypothetical protein
MADLKSCECCGSAVCDGKVATCLGCGTEQCFANGLGRGACKVCLYGILPGWSGSKGTCSYKGCDAPGAFGYVRGKRYVCHAHAKQAKLRGIPLAMFVQAQVAEVRKILGKPYAPDAWRTRGVRALPAEVTP